MTISQKRLLKVFKDAYVEMRRLTRERNDALTLLEEVLPILIRGEQAHYTLVERVRAALRAAERR